MKIKISMKKWYVWDREAGKLVLRWKIQGCLIGIGGCVILKSKMLYTDDEHLKEDKAVIVSRIRKMWKVLQRS